MLIFFSFLSLRPALFAVVLPFFEEDDRNAKRALKLML